MNTASACPLTISRIHQAGLGPWIEPCRVILEHLSGLERVIESPDELPSVAVLSALRTAMAAPLPRQAAILRHQLCRLPLFEYRAAATREMWHPLAEPLEHFLRRHDNAVQLMQAIPGLPPSGGLGASNPAPGGIVWREWAPWPQPEEVSEWLDRWVRC